MINIILNNTDLAYTIDDKKRTKVREELENEYNDDNNTNDKNTNKNDDTSDTDSKIIITILKMMNNN